jgi:beta-glucosidase-like glycosyl hydrolase
MNVDLMPFKEAIKTGVSSIMVGHLSIPCVDSEPATISKKMVTDLLREKLGFKGLIVTDALNMHALKEIENVSVKCVKAGADILLHPAGPDLTVKELISAVETDVIVEKQIEDAVDRVLEIKKKIKYNKEPLSYDDHEKLSSLITEKSITIQKETAGILPVLQKSIAHLVFSGDSNFFNSSPLKACFKDVSTINDTIELKNKIAVFAVFTSIAAWRGSSGIDEDEENRIKELIRKSRNSIVISFGSPYVLRHFRDADILIAAYEASEQAQKAVIKCLKGELDFKGRLPIKLSV